MNDLAEKALAGLDVARRQVRDHPMVSLAATGFVVGAMVVVAGGRAAAARPDRPLTSWLGLAAVRGGNEDTAGSLMLAGVLTLAVVWVAALCLVATRAVPLNRVWWVAAAWAAPFVVGPPLMDTTVYTYVAFGRLLRAGHDPYRAGPSALGNSTVVDAIDPAQRGTFSSTGPVGTVLQHLAVSITNGGLVPALLVWRVIGVLAAIWIARSAADLADGRTIGVVACALNPLVLLYVVSSPHLDAVMVALVLAAVVAAGRRRWWRALVLAGLAGNIGIPGLAAMLVLAAAHWLARRRGRVVARDSAVIVATLAAPTLLQPDGWGWLRNARAPFTGDNTPYSLAGAVEKGLSVVVRVASYDDLAAGGRITAGVAGLCVVIYLLVTVRRRSLVLGVGYALLWLGLLAPVLHPWYLLWGVLALLPTATGQARIALVGLSVAGCVLAPQGFATLTADAVTGGCLAVVAVATGAALWLNRPHPSAVTDGPQPDGAQPAAVG